MRLQREFQRDRDRRQSQQENGARLAWSYGFIQTSGFGEFKVPDSIEFSVMFVEEPAVAYGVALDGDTLEPGNFPRTFGGVSGWTRDPNGLYLGCWVYVVVDSQLINSNYDLRHSFTFAGMALKDAAAEELDS